MYRNRAEERMRTLRGLTRLQELSRRIVAAWDEAYEGARKEQHSDAVLVHKVATIELPVRRVTETEAAEARTKVEALSKDPRNRRLVVWHGDVVNTPPRLKSCGFWANPRSRELGAQGPVPTPPKDVDRGIVVPVQRHAACAPDPAIREAQMLEEGATA